MTRDQQFKEATQYSRHRVGHSSLPLARSINRWAPHLGALGQGPLSQPTQQVLSSVPPINTSAFPQSRQFFSNRARSPVSPPTPLGRRWKRLHRLETT